MQANRSPYPSAERMGVLTASILLTFALSRLVSSPRLTLSIALPGFYFALPLTLGAGMTLLAALLSATGMNWLLGASFGAKARAEHWMLPALTTLVLGAFLALLPGIAAWLPGIAFGGVLLLGVFLAEHIAAEPSAPAYGIARAGLTALGRVLFLIAAAALRFASMRMFLLAPALFLAAFFISLRILRLEDSERWNFGWAAGIGIVCMQIGAGLHYWNLTPIQFAVALAGPFYALTLLFANLAETMPPRRAAFGPALMVLLAWGAAFFLK